MEATKDDAQGKAIDTETPAPKAYRPKVTPLLTCKPGPPALEVPTGYDEMGRLKDPIKCESSEAASTWDARQWWGLR